MLNMKFETKEGAFDKYYPITQNHIYISKSTRKYH